MSYSDLIDHVDNLGRIQDQSNELAGAMLRSHGTNYDRYANLKKLELKTGTPAPWMIDDPELAAETQRRSDLDGSKWQLLSSHAPITSQFASENDHASLMGDDLDNTSLLEKAFGVVSNSARSLSAVPWSMSQGLWAVPRVAGDIAQTWTKPISEFTGLPDTGGAVADYARSQQKGAELTANKIRGDRSNMGLVERGAYSGIESFGQNLVMLPLTIASGGSTVPMLTGMSVVAGGQAYGKARDKNISPLGSLLYGTSQGAIEYATEMIPALRFVNDLKLKSSMGTMARNLFGAEVPGEQIATLTGDLNEWAILNPDKPFADYLRERPSAAAETLIATIVGTGSMVMTAKAAEKTGYSVEKYQQAQLNKNFMLALGESATDSKLLKRLPEKFQELVGRLKEGGDIENVYIPGEQWKTYWQEKGTDPAQMADDLVDGGSAQYVEALAAGGDIVIPLEVYATQLAATEHHAALIEHSRLRAGDATSYEAAQFEADFEQTVKELQDSAGKESADRPSYFKVYDDIYGQLQGIGYDRKTAEQYATIAAVRAKQRAAVLGKDAFELYNESPIKIVRPLPEGVQRQSVDLGIDPLLDRLRNNDVPTDESVFGESLLQFVRKRGVRDDRGDLKSMDVDAELKRKAFQSKDDFEQSKILRKNGMELDRVREGAVEAGFLPEGSTTADLLDKIDQELRGTPVYSNQVANPKEFDTKLALDELKMHLDQVGIDYNQLSNEQIRRELYQMQGGEDTFYQAMVPDSVPVTPESIAEAKRQYDDVVNRYKGTPLWMKAPNGEPTKLTEQQWVQVRTPFFKEWFGDWEAAVTIFQGEQFVKEAIHNKGTGIFKINGIEADPNGDVSKALGSPVTAHELNANDLRHMLRQHGSTKVESAKNQIAVEESDIQLIPYILKNYDNVKQGSSDSTGRKSVIFSKRINGTIYYVEAETVKAGVISSKTMYIKPSLGVNAAQGNLNNTSLTAQSRGHKDSVTKLIGGIKSNVSKVVDANGEPLVVYHQTTAENKDSIYGAGFDLSKVGARGSDEGVPDGIFMKPTDADAGFRGKVQMPLFTNLKNPFLVRDRESLDSFLRMSEQYFKWSQETVFTDKEKAREFDKIEKGSNDLDAMDAFIEQWKQLNESNAAQSREAATEFLRNEGFDGVVLDRDKGSFGREVKTIIAFDPNQVKSSVDNVGTFSKDTGNILYQGEAKKRGFFRSSPDMTAREIGILKDADLSTFIHESSHSWLEELKADAARADAPGQLKNDWATVAKWLGNTDGEITREQHEQFARGGEAYFMEGKAPSAELQPIMQRFKSWLTSIYKTLTGLNVKMNDDVRGVFDRLLASEAEITQARQAQNMVELFATAEDAGMTTAEFAAYRKQAAQAHADEVEKLDRKLMQEKAREQAQWWKDARAAMRTEVEAEAHAAPVYRAIRLLSSGKMFDGTEGPVMKLDRAVLVKMYGEPFLKRLPRGFGYIYANEGGMHPDAVASLFGYDSGDAMIKEMIEAPAVNKWIDGETDMRMREQYGDMLLDGTVADEALAAIHGDRRADVMAAELRAIKRQQKIVKPALDAQKKDDQQNRQVMNASVPSRETFQMAAAQIIGAKKIGDISPRLYLEAERRAGKKAFDAVAKKDWQTAAEAKQQQLLNHYLYREASKAQEQIDDIMKEYDKLKRPDEKLAKSRDINLVNAARAILNRFGIDKNGLDAAEHLKQVEIYTPDLYQDLSAAIEAATQSPKLAPPATSPAAATAWPGSPPPSPPSRRPPGSGR